MLVRVITDVVLGDGRKLASNTLADLPDALGGDLVSLGAVDNNPDAVAYLANQGEQPVIVKMPEDYEPGNKGPNGAA